MTTTSGMRGPRADARRNRDHILDVAEQHFSEHGVTGSLDAIARRAGVGAGTLYRHFPTREALLAALLEARDVELERQRDAIRQDAPDAGRALRGWLAALTDWSSAFDGLPEPLRAAMSVEASPLALTCQGYITTTDEFLAEAQREGSARSDVRGRELFLVALATSWARGAAMADKDSPDAIADLTRRGWSTPPSGR